MLRINRLIHVAVILFVLRISIFTVPKSSISLDLFTIIQIGLVFGIFILLLIQKTTKLKPIIRDISYFFLSTFYLMGLVSFFWSAIPVFSLYMAFQNLILISALFYLASTKDSFLGLESFLINSSFLWIIIEVAGDLFQQGFSFILNWHNLETGGISGMLLCYSAGELLAISKYPIIDKERKDRLRRTAIVSILILIFSTSSGANVSVLVGLLTLVFVGKSFLLKLTAFLIIFLLLVFPEMVSLALPFIFPGKSTSGINTFGYRVHLWESYWEMIKEKPLFGWGYASIERISKYYNIDAHNSLIGAVGGLGFTGGVLLLSQMVSSVKKSFDHRNEPGQIGLFSAFICLIVNSNTFGFLSSKTTLLTIAFFTLMAVSYFYLLNPYVADNKENE